jgi:hypothetical protein
MVDPTLKRIFQLDTVANPAASISDARIELEMKVGPNGTFKNVQLTWEQFLALVAGTASAPTAEQVFNLFQTGTGVDLHLQDGEIYLNLRPSGDTATPRPPAPRVTGFLPSKGIEGTNVTITGSLFTEITSVSFNGTPAPFQVINSTTLQAVVPEGATTGPVAVSTEGSTGTSAASFTVGATVTPTPDLTAALALSLAQITLGGSVGYSITPGGGTAPYSYQVTATSLSTSTSFSLGTTKSGTWQPPTADQYQVDATVTDSSSPAKVAQAATRYLNVVAAANRIPVADAGQDVTVQLPTSSLALMGRATDPDTGDTIEGHAWRYVTGPNVPTGLPASTQNVVVSGLVEGAYQFGYRATDNHGGQSAEDYVLVTVQPVAGGKTANILYDWGQSQDNGLSPLTGLPSEYLVVNPDHEAYDYTTNKTWPYSQGSINPSTGSPYTMAEAVAAGDYRLGSSAHGITKAIVPSYDNGFGPDVGFFAEVRKDPNNNGRKWFSFKPDLTPPASTDGASLLAWFTGIDGREPLYTKYLAQHQAFMAYLRSQGYTNFNKIFASGLGEQDSSDYTNKGGGTNPDFKGDFLRALTRLTADGVIDDNTLLILNLKQRPQDGVIAQAQRDIVAARPGSKLAVLSNPLFLSRDGTHYQQATMLELGAAMYKLWAGTLVSGTPYPVVAPGAGLSVIEAEATGWADFVATWQNDQANAAVYANRGTGADAGAYTTTTGAYRRRTVTAFSVGITAPNFGGGGKIGLRVFDAGGTKVFDQVFDNDYPGGGNTRAGGSSGQIPQLNYPGTGVSATYTVEVYNVSGTSIYDALILNYAPATAPGNGGLGSITSVSPSSTGTSSGANKVVVKGTNLTGVTAATVGGKAVPFTQDSGTQVTLTIVPGSVSGYVELTINGAVIRSAAVVSVGDVTDSSFGPYASIVPTNLAADVSLSNGIFLTSRRGGGYGFATTGPIAKILAGQEGGYYTVYDQNQYYGSAVFGLDRSSAGQGGFAVSFGYYFEPSAQGGHNIRVLVDANPGVLIKRAIPGGRYLQFVYQGSDGNFNVGLFESTDGNLWNLIHNNGLSAPADLYFFIKFDAYETAGLVGMYSSKNLVLLS